MGSRHRARDLAHSDSFARLATRYCHVAGALAVALLALSLGCVPTGRPAAFDPDTVPEAYARSTAALMWPGATRAFQVTPEGNLENGEWRVRISAESGEEAAAAPRVIAYEERCIPVVRWRRTSANVRWDFEAVALPEPAPRDTGLYVSLEVTATNLARQARNARLELQFVPLDSTSIFRAADSPSTDAATHAWTDGASTGSARGVSAAPTVAGVTQWTLAAGAQSRARFVLSAYATDGARLSAWARVPHRRRVDETRAAWNKLLARGAHFALGDTDAEAALNGALVTLLACREHRGALWVPIGNPFQYRDVWLRDGARAIRALSVAGFTEESRDLARGLEAFEWPGGAYLSQRGQLDGTGQAMWAFEQAHLRPEPDTSVARVAERALGGVQWGQRQRSLGIDSRSPFNLMLPWGDPRDNELVSAQLVGNDAWLLAGYRSEARLLRAAGRTADAESVEVALRFYREDFAKALEQTGSADIPPSWQNTGRDWGNISVSVPCGALPVSHPRMAALAARLWKGAGGPGLGFYAHSDSMHAYLFADLATWAMLTGRRDAAARMLDSLMAWRSASGGIAEYFSRSTRDWGRNAPPHLTSAAALVSMLRDCVVYDEDDTLRLTMGARSRWWRGASVTNAPTRWGVADIRFERRDDVAHWQWRKVPVWTALTLPPGTVIAVAPAAPLVGAPGATRVLAPPGVAFADVRVRAAP